MSENDDWKFSDAALRNRDVAQERIRVQAITTLGRQFSRRDLSDRAVTFGTPIKHFERELLKELAEPVRPLGVIGMTPSEVRQWSLFRWLNDPSPDNDLLEVECSRAVAKAVGIDSPIPGQLFVPREVLTRDLNTTQGSSGGYFVSTQVQSFTGALYAASVTGRLGATRLTGLVGDAVVPRVAASATGYWLSTETEAPTESTATLDELAMTPKTVGALVELSRKLVKQASPSVENLAMADLGGVLAQAVDAGAINGTGTLGQPLGVLNTSGIGAFTGTSLDLAALTNAQVDVATSGAIVRGDSLGYATTPAVGAVLKARQRFTGVDRALWEGAVHEGEVEGVRAMSSTNVPTASMIYGDWSQLLIGEWGVLDIRTNPFQNFKAGIVAIRAFWSIDTGLRHRSAFSVASSIT